MSQQTIPADSGRAAEGPLAGAPDLSDAAGAHRLERDALDLRHLITASLANIGPALGLYFSIGVIAANAGLASPAAVLLGVIGLAGTAFTVASFVRQYPAVGSFVSFITKAFGSRGGIGFGLPLQFGYVLLNAGTAIALGSWTHDFLVRWLHVDVPWQLISILGAGAIYSLIVIGVKTTVHGALTMFAFEMVVLALVAVLVLVNGDGLSSAPLTTHSPNGSTGIGLAFVLALYMFIGWEAPVTFSEEARNPRKIVPLSLMITLAVGAVTYVSLTYIALIGFHNDPAALSGDTAPFDTLGRLYGNTFVRILVDAAGFTSIIGSLLASAASQSRVTFEMGRIGMLPSALGRTHPRFRTPYVALGLFYSVTVLIVLIWGAITDGAINVFGQVAGLGTIPVVVIYLAVNLAGVVFALRGGRIYRNNAIGIPISAVAFLIMCYPLYQLVKPGQDAPFSAFPWIVLAVTLLSFAYGLALSRRRPRLAERVDALLASE